MSQRCAVTLFAFCAVLLWGGVASAFREAGHRSIEAAAYRKLLYEVGACQKEADGTFTLTPAGLHNSPKLSNACYCPSDRTNCSWKGKDVIDKLLRFGV